MYTPLLLPIRATCPAHLILALIARIFGEDYRPLSSSLCSFLQSPVISSVLGPTPSAYVHSLTVTGYSQNRFTTGWMVRDSKPGWDKIFLYTSRPTLMPTQSPVQWVSGTIPGGKAARAWRWPPTPI
jgi:hypothetical protein